jgi:hypothetical protein
METVTNKAQIEETIHRLKSFDPLASAEKITGESIHNPNSLAVSLGLLMHMDKHSALDKLYDNIDDTKFSNTVEEYIRKVSKAGFEVIYTEDFTYTPDYETKRKQQQEKLYVLWNAEYGIMIIFDTFHGNVNSGKMCYNYSPNSLKTNGCTSSGHFYFPKEHKMGAGHIGLIEPDMITPYFIPDYPKDIEWAGELWTEYRKKKDPIDQKQSALVEKAITEGKRVVWIGYHDGREGIISTINRMLSYGKFLPKWIECPYSWITHFAEHKGDCNYPFTSHYEVTRQRMAKFPKEVQERLAPYRQD